MDDIIGQFLGTSISKNNPIKDDRIFGKGYATLLTNDNFYPGVEALCKSLKATSTVYPIVVLVTSQVSEATKIRLKSICNQTIPVEAIICPYKNNEHEASWTNSELTKLHIWNLLQFEKVVYLDADTLVIENIGELFEIQSSFAASPDIFPPDKFNAGLLVIQPNASVFHEMISLVGVLSSHDGGDTGFLNSYFSNWYTSSPESRLSFGYNAQRTLFWFTHAKQPGYWESIKPLKVIHYSSSPKPWEVSPSAGGTLGELEWKWWKLYMGM